MARCATKSGRACGMKYSAPRSKSAETSSNRVHWPRKESRSRSMSSVEQSLTLPAAPPTSPIFAGAARAARRLFARWAVVGAFLLLWEIAPRAHWVEPAFLPPFSEVLRTAWRLLASGQLLQHVQASLSRSLTGFALAIGYAV